MKLSSIQMNYSVFTVLQLIEEMEDYKQKSEPMGDL